jgi:NADPH-dependent glutamate synthase beta subunit-like oxidoreductase
MKNTLVIGGGDVAMDCSRTAIRLGGQVTLMSLESYDLMPASSEEKIQCQEEGVKLVTGYGINYISGESIHLSKCLEVFDCENKFNPTMLASDQVLEDIDTIILAIGQNNDLSFLSENGGTSNEKPVYFCGDVTDPTNVIDAIAKGKKAALNLHHNFGGHELFTGETVEVPEDVLSILSFDYDHKNVRTIPQKDRFLNFEPVNQNYTFEEAFYEANRCMRCDQNSKAPLLLGRKNI